MENQINIGDQNNQEIGQNPINQPPTFQEKPKINYWTILTVFLTIIILLGGLYILNIRGQKAQSENSSGQSARPKITSTPSPVTVSWKTYTNSKYGFEIKYPPTWIFEESDYGVNIKAEGNDKVLYALSIGAKKDVAREDIGFDNYKKSDSGSNYTVGEKTINGADIIIFQTDYQNNRVIKIYAYKDYRFIEMTWNSPLDDQQYNSTVLQIASSLNILPINVEKILVNNWQSANSKCSFSFKFPSDWKDNKDLIQDSNDSCVYLTAPGYEEGLDSRTGFYLSIARTIKGTQFKSVTINSLEDHIKANEALWEPPTVKVQNKENKTIGVFSGIMYDPTGYEPGRIFIFLQGNYIYGVNWPTEETTKYWSIIEAIIKSIQF